MEPIELRTLAMAEPLGAVPEDVRLTLVPVAGDEGDGSDDGGCDVTTEALRDEYAPNGFLASLAADDDDGRAFASTDFSLARGAGATTGADAANRTINPDDGIQEQQKKSHLRLKNNTNYYN
jgi:hypothetical protein